MSWYEVYLKDIEKKGTLENYVVDKIRNKKILINLIEKYALNKNIIETGCGTGILSTYLSTLGYNSTAIDIDDKILNLAEKISKKYSEKYRPMFIKKSIFELNYGNNEFDVAFSNGVLEHFDDKKIILTLEEQMNISNVVIFGIPTRYFNKDEAMYGDERYLSYSYWRNLIKKAGGIILEEKSMHYMDWLHRIVNFKKYFRPYPYRIFVITKRK